MGRCFLSRHTHCCNLFTKLSNKDTSKRLDFLDNCSYTAMVYIYLDTETQEFSHYWTSILSILIWARLHLPQFSFSTNFLAHGANEYYKTNILLMRLWEKNWQKLNCVKMLMNNRNIMFGLPPLPMEKVEKVEKWKIICLDECWIFFDRPLLYRE